MSKLPIEVAKHIAAVILPYGMNMEARDIQDRLAPDTTPALAGPTPERLYTIQDAKHILGVSRRSIYDWIAAGKIHAIHLGQRRMIPASELQRLTNGGWSAPRNNFRAQATTSASHSSNP